MSGQGRLLALDSLRGIAALIVLLWHLAANFFPLLGWGRAVDHSSSWESYFYGGFLSVLVDGTFAVLLFFLLSGYVLTSSLMQTGNHIPVLERIAARLPRLFVPVTTTTLLYFFAETAMPALGIGACDQSALIVDNLKRAGTYEFILPYLKQTNYCNWSDLPAEVVRNIFWDPWFEPGNKAMFNGVLWTMSIESQGSFLVMGLSILLYRLGGRMLVAIGLPLLAFAIPLYFRTYGIYFSYFLLGATISALRIESASESAKLNLLAILLLAAGMYLGGKNAHGIANFVTPAVPGLAAVWTSVAAIKGLGALLVMLGVLLPGWPRRAGSANTLVFLGRISFSLYLIHMLIILKIGHPSFAFLVNFVPVNISALLASAIVITGSLLFAYLLTLCVDEPSVAWARQFGKRVVSTSIRNMRATRPAA